MTNIEQNVMRRVHTIYILRPFFSGLFVGSGVLAVALLSIGKAVWVARVFENAPQSFSLLPQFYLVAFTHTDLMVQLLSLTAFVSVVYLARETAKLISSGLVPVRA